jgi:glycerophosphoryl diester phosphodiesterase
MRDAGSEVFVIGPYGPGEIGTSGIDTKEDVEALPATFTGGIWTNRIERVAPLFDREGEPVAP